MPQVRGAIQVRMAPPTAHRHSGLRACIGAAGSALLLLIFPAVAPAQEAKVSFRVASDGSGSLPLFSLAAAGPATNRDAMLPSLTLTSNDTGPQVQNVVFAFPDMALGGLAVRSRLGDQPLPAMFRASSLAGSSLASPVRGLNLTTAGSTPLSLSFGQTGINAGTGTSAPGAPSLMALGTTLAPSSRVSVTPQAIVPVGSPEAQTSISTAIRAELLSGVAFVTDVGAARTDDVGWAPLGSASLVGRWSHAGLETSVVRGAHLPQTDTGAGIVRSRDQEAARGHVRPLPGLTLSALTSWSRPATDPDSPDTTAGSLGVTYEGLPRGLLAAVHEHQMTASWESETTRFEWRQGGLSGVNLRYLQKRETDSAVPGAEQASSRLELDLPALASRQAGSRLDLRAALAAGSASAVDPGGFSSRVSGRIDLVNDVALAGETELGLTGSDAHVLRAFRLTTDVAMWGDTGLQLLYSYRAGSAFSVGQAFEARMSRRINLGFW